jgi:hypothetical protein
MEQIFSNFNIGDIVTLESDVFPLKHDSKRHKVVLIDDSHIEFEYDRNHYEKGKESFGGHFVLIDRKFFGDVKIVKI